MLVDKNIKEFTEVLSSKSPIPGGGGASALVGALGVSLGNMVGELTVGKKKYASVEPEIRELMSKAKKLQERLLECIEKDAIAFEPLSKAYGLPKETPHREEIMEKCLKEAMQPPLEIFKLSVETIKLQGEFAEKGSSLVLSDAATGVAFALGAMKGAAVNVKVNTKFMKNREFAEDMNSYIDENLKQYSLMAETIYAGIYERF